VAELAVEKAEGLTAGTGIGGNAFWDCTSLSSVSLPATPPTIVPGELHGMFYATNNGSSEITIVVPNAAAVTAYKNAWGEADAGGKPGVYGSNHKAVTIEAAAP
jgi:hypothetical protein